MHRSWRWPSASAKRPSRPWTFITHTPKQSDQRLAELGARVWRLRELSRNAERLDAPRCRSNEGRSRPQMPDLALTWLG